MNTTMRTASPRRRRRQSLDNAGPVRRIVLRLAPLGDYPEHYPGRRLWTAEHYLGDQPDPFIVDLFGDHVLPTSFMEATPGEVVLEYMRASHPDDELALADDED